MSYSKQSKIGVIWYALNQEDNRGINQLCRCLIELGHKPTVVPRGDYKGVEKTESGIPISYLPKTKSFYFSKLDAPLPFNFNWVRWIVKLGKIHNWDALFVRETPLVFPVLLSAWFLKIPVYMDMRENIGAMYRAGTQRGLIAKIVRNAFFVSLYEKLCLKHLNHIFTVSPELREWLINNYKIDRSDVSVLENTPSKNFLAIAENQLLKDKKRYVDLVYAGAIVRRKGVGDIVDAMPIILSKRPKVKLRIIGDGIDLKSIQKQVKKMNLSESVEFLPMLSMPDYVEALSECQIGLELCWLNELTQQTVPGKLFEYMALGLAIISSPRIPVKRILSQTGCGLFYESLNPDAIATIVLDLLSDPQKQKMMQRNARKAIIERYNWSTNLKNLQKNIKFS